MTTTYNSIDDFDYLRAPASALKINHTDYYKRHGEGKKSIRKIFYETIYDDFERKNWDEFEELIAGEKDMVFPPGWQREDTLRFLYSQKFDAKKSLKVLKAHLEWKADPNLKLLRDDHKQFLTDGIFYQYGRDKQLRPIVVLNVYKIDLKTASLDAFMGSLGFILHMVEKYMFLNGKIENWVILIETNGVGLFNFPFKILGKIIGVTSANFTSRLEKLYILNPSFTLNASWNIISGMLDPETAQKINFLKKSAFNQLLNQIDADQLEVKYGGTRPNLTSNFWPPQNTLSEPPMIPEPVHSKPPVEVKLLNLNEVTTKKEVLVEKTEIVTVKKEITVSSERKPVYTNNSARKENIPLDPNAPLLGGAAAAHKKIDVKLPPALAKIHEKQRLQAGKTPDRSRVEIIVEEEGMSATAVNENRKAYDSKNKKNAGYITQETVTTQQYNLNDEKIAAMSTSNQGNTVVIEETVIVKRESVKIIDRLPVNEEDEAQDSMDSPNGKEENLHGSLSNNRQEIKYENNSYRPGRFCGVTLCRSESNQQETQSEAAKQGCNIF